MSVNKIFDEVYSISIKRLLRLPRKEINIDTIEKSISLALEFLNIKPDSFEKKEFDRCSKSLLAAFKTEIGNTSTISSNDDHEAWYDPNQKRPYWETHKEYLLEISKKPIDVVNEIDKSTNEVLGLLESPHREGAWDRRGLVVGNVQWKTSNFIALINKAADAGYKFIVVLSKFN